jgi:hypothetical protein
MMMKYNLFKKRGGNGLKREKVGEYILLSFALNINQGRIKVLFYSAHYPIPS